MTEMRRSPFAKETPKDELISGHWLGAKAAQTVKHLTPSLV